MILTKIQKIFAISILVIVILIAIFLLPKKEKGKDLCESVNISGNILLPDKPLIITAKAKTNNIKYFLYIFSNRDNRFTDKNNTPKYIKFSPITPYHFILKESKSLDTNSIIVNYDNLNRPDINWSDQKPKHIQVDVYFEDNNRNRSVKNSKCEVSFDVE